jgi:hypothetical protein
MENIKHEQKMELERLALEQVKLQHQQKASMEVAEKAVSKPSASSNSEDSGTKQSTGSKIVESFKKHPLLWGLGIGAVVTGVGGIAMYASLPTLTKIGLALL